MVEEAGSAVLRAAAAHHGNRRPICILPCQWSAPAAVWERTQVRLPVCFCISGSSLPAPTPPDTPFPKADPETDLLPVEEDEAGAAKGGCCCQQETGPPASDFAVSRNQGGEEVGSQLPETQTQRKTCLLTPEVDSVTSSPAERLSAQHTSSSHSDSGATLSLTL